MPNKNIMRSGFYAFEQSMFCSSLISIFYSTLLTESLTKWKFFVKMHVKTSKVCFCPNRIVICLQFLESRERLNQLCHDYEATQAIFNEKYQVLSLIYSKYHEQQKVTDILQLL